MPTLKIKISLAHLQPLIRVLSFQPNETDSSLPIERPSKTSVLVVNGGTCQLVPFAGNQLNCYSYSIDTCVESHKSIYPEEQISRFLGYLSN